MTRRCCTPDNLRAEMPQATDRVVRRCIVCGARHIELHAEPGRLGVRIGE